jgi:hypothetical protein
MPIPFNNGWSVRVVTLVSVLSLSTLAHAQVPSSIGTSVPLDSSLPQSSVSASALPSVQLPIASWRMSEADVEKGARRGRATQPAGQQPSTRARVKKGLQRAAAGVAFGVGGFFLGGILGARLEGNSCVCDDPGLKGFLIGAPIGAVAGAMAGVAMVK